MEPLPTTPPTTTGRPGKAIIDIAPTDHTRAPVKLANTGMEINDTEIKLSMDIYNRTPNLNYYLQSGNF